jgi:hypothetical protein
VRQIKGRLRPWRSSWCVPFRAAISSERVPPINIPSGNCLRKGCAIVKDRSALEGNCTKNLSARHKLASTTSGLSYLIAASASASRPSFELMEHRRKSARLYARRLDGRFDARGAPAWYRNRAADKRRGHVHPKRREMSRNNRRRDRPCRIHRCAADRPGEHRL